MISKHRISIEAVVTSPERALIETAARVLAEALSKATGETWTYDCSFHANLDELAGPRSGVIIITSLQVPLTSQMETPWSALEQSLRASYAKLSESAAPIMICTILRHVSPAGESDLSGRILRRLRQLNLLATELSREYGALIIDLDRILADIGARRLGTDYRLGGADAVNVASNAIALGIAANALDGIVAVDLQDAARSALETDRPTVGLSSEIKMTNVMSLGHGRRKQLVSTVTDTVQENHAGWLIRQTIKGNISIREASSRFFQAVRNRGARESATLLIGGIIRIFRTEN